MSNQSAVSSVFGQYRKKQIAELRPYIIGENLDGVSVTESDKQAGSPKDGDMIARNPKNYDDQWLVSKQFFDENYESV